MKYRIFDKNNDKVYVDTDYNDIRLLAFTFYLQNEALTKEELTKEEVFKYGLFTANAYGFLSKLFTLQELLSVFDAKMLKSEIINLNNLRKTKYNIQKTQKFIKKITEDYIKNEKILEINDNNGWKNKNYEVSSKI